MFCVCCQGNNYSYKWNDCYTYRNDINVGTKEVWKRGRWEGWWNFQKRVENIENKSDAGQSHW